jgi:fructose-bisphosphate aldolase class I
VAQALVAKDKGILAADESIPTIKKRFDKIGLPSTEENRRAYRELLFTTPGLASFISGVIMFDETLRQSTKNGIPFPSVLVEKGIIPGIKVDRGAKPLAGFPDEKITEGLDGLRDRLAEYRALGAKFAKWRAVITIGPDLPSQACLKANAHALARYAALCQEAELVPIVEPEVLMDGDHSLARCQEVTMALLQTVFTELQEQKVVLEASLLKPNMVLPGQACPQQVSVEQVARATLHCFKEIVPAALPGIVFLSGGQSPIQATEHLNAMNLIGPHPWELSFSYGRALQDPVLSAWQGQAANISVAQAALYHRARCNSAARSGQYSPEMELKDFLEPLVETWR